MGSRKTYEGAEKVYDAAEAWVRIARCGPMTHSSRQASRSGRASGLENFIERFLDRPDESGDSFLLWQVAGGNWKAVLQRSTN